MLELHRFASDGSLEPLHGLIQAGADPNLRDKKGKTALHEACAHGHEGCAKVLLKAGALVSAHKTNGFTPIHYAAAGGHASVVSLLHASGANPNEPDHKNDRPLNLAARAGHLHVAELLLMLGADCSLKTKNGRTSLHSASLHGHEDVVQLLLSAGADPSAPDSGGTQPIHDAAASGHVGCMELLVKAGANPCANDCAGSQPLHIAASAGNVEAARWLIFQSKVDPDCTDSTDSTPLYWAASRGRVDMVTFLLHEAKANPCKKNIHRTPLHVAAGWGHADVCKELLKAGADLLAVDKDGVSPLELAQQVPSVPTGSIHPKRLRTAGREAPSVNGEGPGCVCVCLATDILAAEIWPCGHNRVFILVPISTNSWVLSSLLRRRLARRVIFRFPSSKCSRFSKAKAARNNNNKRNNNNSSSSSNRPETSNAEDDRDLTQQASALGSKTKPCTKFFSTSGCPYGEGCHFLHYVPGGINSLQVQAANGTAAGANKTATSQSGATADPAQTVNGYKTRLCNRYNTPEGCRFGEKCHFAHGESDLRPSNTRTSQLPGQTATYLNGTTLFSTNPVATSVYYGEPTPPGVPAATTFGNISVTRMSIEAAYAGAIIGKAGANVKQISKVTGCKVSIRDHETDPNMRNVEMEGSLEQIESASEMVRQLLQTREVAPPRGPALGSHNFKTKLCENYSSGTCTFAERCHFAHGAQELRPIIR